jgi:hypothetical protein
VTRRGLRLALGALWILDGLLQLQPFMFGRGYARQVIAPAADGQPRFVSSGVHWAADLIAAHSAAWDLLFALTQLAIGVALLMRRTVVVQAALAASVAWAVGVWYFGEGLGGLGSGQFDLVTGAPGAVLLYGVLAVAAWPAPASETDNPPPPWLVVPWALLWCGAALWQVLPAQRGAVALTGDLRDNAGDAPGWLASLDRSVAAHLSGSGTTTGILFVVVLAAIGLGAIVPGISRRVATGAGIVLATVMWVLGQSLGELYTGQSTDPNSAPLLVLLALSVASIQPAVHAARQSQRAPRHSSRSVETTEPPGHWPL